MVIYLNIYVYKLISYDNDINNCYDCPEKNLNKCDIIYSPHSLKIMKPLTVISNGYLNILILKQYRYIHTYIVDKTKQINIPIKTMHDISLSSS